MIKSKKARQVRYHAARAETMVVTDNTLAKPLFGSEAGTTKILHHLRELSIKCNIEFEVGYNTRQNVISFPCIL